LKSWTPHYLGIAALSLLLSACVTQDVQLDRRHVDPVSKKSLVGNRACTLPGIRLTDARSYKGMGWIGGHELLYPELEPWIVDALTTAAQTDADATRLEVELNRAYIESHPSGHSFQLVLRVREQGHEERRWRVYRGNQSGVTWWGNGGEFGQYVEDAGREAIAALVKAEGRCSKGRSG
jgi:hypothetical protein